MLSDRRQFALIYKPVSVTGMPGASAETVRQGRCSDSTSIAGRPHLFGILRYSSGLQVEETKQLPRSWVARRTVHHQAGETRDHPARLVMLGVRVRLI